MSEHTSSHTVHNLHSEHEVEEMFSQFSLFTPACGRALNGLQAQPLERRGVHHVCSNIALKL